jgi:uncharacterized membrane protein
VDTYAVHGRVQDESYYLIRYSELDLPGETDIDFRVELNTQNKTPGTYKVSVIAYSTQQSYNYKKQDLSLVMN